jgi:Zn-dependent protease
VPDLSLQQLLLRLTGVLLVSAVHGFILTLVARRLGDSGPEHDGRLTLNPFQHLAPLGALGMLFYTLGWIKPLAVDPRRFRQPRIGALLLALSGVLGTLTFTLLLSLARPMLFRVLPEGIAFGTLQLVDTTIGLSVWFTLLNLVPVPPLTGGYLLIALEPAWLRRLHPNYLPLKLALAALIITGVAASLLEPLYLPLSRLLLGG